MKDYFVYILKCSDDSYYTGVTNNLEKRISEHKSGVIKGYTSSRLPVELVFLERFSDVNQAIIFEKQVKDWNRKKERSIDKQKLLSFSLLIEFEEKIVVILRQSLP